MKLAYSELIDVLTLKHTHLSTLVIENQRLFSTFVRELSQQIDGGTQKFTLSENEKIINLAQSMEIVINPLAIEINSRKLQTKLFEVLNATAYNENYFLDTMELRQKLVAYGYKLLQSENLPLVLNEDFKHSELFKALDIRFESFTDDIPLALANYIDVHRNFLNIKVLVLVNIKSYVSEEELLLLFKQASLRNLNLLLIESSVRDSLKDEHVTIIDSDLCVVKKDF